jgi:hypothetical protein
MPFDTSQASSIVAIQFLEYLTRTILEPIEAVVARKIVLVVERLPTL